jgi:hypothetical protein
MIISAALLAITSIVSDEAEIKLQQDLITFATSNLGKQVGSGQCAELVAEALDKIQAKPFGTWPDEPSTGDYVWGKKIATLTKDSPTPTLLPGTILQFRDVRVVTKSGYATFTFKAEQHTLIVEKFNAETGEAYVLEQNSQGRTYVTRDTLNLKGIKAGTIWAYTPQPR